MFLSSALELIRLRRQQWLGPEQLEVIQQRKLRRIVKHAYENVPYYRKLFDSAGVKPEEIRTKRDLSRIPITTKAELQKHNPEEFLSKGVAPEECTKIATSGSTGMPLTVYFRRSDIDWIGLYWARASMECGQGLWSRSAYIKHHHLDKYWFQRLGIWRRYVLSTAKGADEHIKLLKRARPDVLRGYVKRLLYLASVIEQKRIGGISPRVVFSMGGVLDPDAREFLESVFKGEVFDFYGATELGCIAWECPRHDGYHVNVDSLVLELISDGRSALPGEPGRIVCTALDLRTMPFIRYDIGDIGIASNKKCSCGRGLPMLESIKGRANDFFVSADGSLYSPPRLLNLLGEVTGISQFRVIQETAEDVTILVVPGRDFSEKSVTAVEAVGAKVFGPRLRVRTSVVSDLPPDTSGKIRCLISRVGERPPNRRERS